MVSFQRRVSLIVTYKIRMCSTWEKRGTHWRSVDLPSTLLHLLGQNEVRTKVLKVQHVQASERPANISNSAHVEGGARDFINHSRTCNSLTMTNVWLQILLFFNLFILMETQTQS